MKTHIICNFLAKSTLALSAFYSLAIVGAYHILRNYRKFIQKQPFKRKRPHFLFANNNENTHLNSKNMQNIRMRNTTNYFSLNFLTRRRMIEFQNNLHFKKLITNKMMILKNDQIIHNVIYKLTNALMRYRPL